MKKEAIKILKTVGFMDRQSFYINFHNQNVYDGETLLLSNGVEAEDLKTIVEKYLSKIQRPSC